MKKDLFHVSRFLWQADFGYINIHVLLWVKYIYLDIYTSSRKTWLLKWHQFPKQLKMVRSKSPSHSREDNRQASSFRGYWHYSHFGIWKGHEVNSEFVGLLHIVLKKYRETLEYFTTKSKKFCTMELNTLCSLVNAFTQTSITEVHTEMIAEYRALFSDLQRPLNIK